MNTHRRAVLAAALAAPIVVQPARAGFTTGKITLEHLHQSYSQLKEFIYLYNEQTGIPDDRAEEYLYKRLMQVQVAVDLGMR